MTALQAEPGRPPAEAPIIELRGVTKVYGEGRWPSRPSGVDLRIAQGDFVAIMGPSGSGKSTAMNTLGCLDRPTTANTCSRACMSRPLSRDERALLRRRYFGFVFRVQPAGAHLGARKECGAAAAVPGRICGQRKAAAAGRWRRWGSNGWGTSHPGRTVGRAAAARGHCARHRSRAGGAAGR